MFVIKLLFDSFQIIDLYISVLLCLTQGHKEVQTPATDFVCPLTSNCLSSSLGVITRLVVVKMFLSSFRVLHLK